MPTAREIDKLLSFLPRLTVFGFKPAFQSHGGWKDDKTSVLPSADYRPVVDEFFELASRECWLDRDYHPATAGRMLEAGHIERMLRRVGELRDAGLLER